MRSIDIHAHLTPQCFWRATENGGDWHTIRREKDARGMEQAIVGDRRQSLPPRARWTPQERLADMDSLGVDVHVVSPYVGDRKSTRLNSSHSQISYAVFCLKKKKNTPTTNTLSPITI